MINKSLQDFAYLINLEWWMFALAGMIALIIAIVTLGVPGNKSSGGVSGKEFKD